MDAHSRGPGIYNNKKNRVASAIIDADDVDKVKKYTWFLDSDGYVIAHYGKTTIKLHRLVYGCTQGQEIDHEDLNKLNNRKRNLHICTRSQNNFNRRILNPSGLKGISYHKKRKHWVAQITSQGLHYNLGAFQSKEDAAKAYNSAAVKLAGKFAHLNFQRLTKS